MRMLSLFAGIGGIDLAAHWAGIETVAFCEIEPFCQQVLQKHWPEVPIFDDVRTINKQQLIEQGVIVDERAIDIICGGYPCQPFSNAGERLGEEDDRHLWPEMFRLIKELRPNWVLGENVDGHVTLGLDTVLTDLEGEGYSTRSFIIPACGVYAPHRRYRVFVVGHTERSGCSGESRRRTMPIVTNGHYKLEKGILANTTSKRRRTRRTKSEGQQGDSSLTGGSLPQCEVLADTEQFRSSRQREPIEPVYSTSDRERQTSGTLNVCFGEKWSTKSRVGGSLDGISDWLDQFEWPAALGEEQYEWEPPRVISGMNGKSREARLKALGNAVNPVQVFPIMWGIKQISLQTDT